jgi:YD repeat-containing protein
MLRLVIILLAALSLQVLITPRAAAQSAGCNVQVQYCVGCGDPVLPGMHGCISESSYLSVCNLPAWWCAPPDSANETRCPSCNQTQPAAAHPINLANGDTFIIETDTKIPGIGGGLELTRTWNSTWPSQDSAYQIGMFGPNWRSTYEERVFVGSDYYFKYLRSDGSIWSFGWGPGKPEKFRDAAMMLATPMAYGMPRGISGLLGTGDNSHPSGGGGGGGGGAEAGMSLPLANYFTMITGTGEQRQFSVNTGLLVAIIDRNGNTTTLSYDSSNRLTKVTDSALPVARYLQFSYGTGTGSLVTSVASNFGVSMSYSYDTNGRLTQVTEPDSSTVSFEYDTNGLISTVLDSDGHVLETHTYDSSGRGLTAGQADGVNAVTVTYTN